MGQKSLKDKVCDAMLTKELRIIIETLYEAENMDNMLWHTELRRKSNIGSDEVFDKYLEYLMTLNIINKKKDTRIT